MSQFLLPLTYVVAFAAVVLLVQTLASAALARRDATQRINRRLTLLEAGMKPEEVYAALARRPTPLSTGNERLNRAITGLALRMHQAGLEVSVGRLLATAALGGLLLWLLALAILAVRGGGSFIENAVVTLAGAVVIAAGAAWLYVGNRRGARMKALERQLPPALDIVNRGLRAGHPVIAAVQLAANEMGDPIGTEFGLIVDENSYGLEFKDALANFAHRTGSADAHFFAVAVSIQSETGGNLAEILDGLASVVRGRATLALRVRSLSSEGRMSALVLSVLPILLIGSMLLFVPSFYASKFSDPVFWPAVAIVGVVYAIGQYMIHRIINFKY
ncbi:MAG TPA: type II secretion system F family protein [Caulobacteraceae bacterium]|nr:type II secretion system F family protein [Caulobacteraceae bacterium]